MIAATIVQDSGQSQTLDHCGASGTSQTALLGANEELANQG